MLQNVKYKLNHSKVALRVGLQDVWWLGCCGDTGLRGVVGVVVGCGVARM